MQYTLHAPQLGDLLMKVAALVIELHVQSSLSETAVEVPQLTLTELQACLMAIYSIKDVPVNSWFYMSASVNYKRIYRPSGYAYQNQK